MAKTKKTLLLVGTRKGAFLLDSDNDRRDWRVRGPFCEAWPINHVTLDRKTGAVLAGGGSEWFGPAVWRSSDLGETWTQSGEGLGYGDDGPKLKTVWHVHSAHGALWAGVDPAGLFRSDDGGLTWSHVSGLRAHHSTPEWQPGAGGLCLHSIVPHATDPNQMWIAISAVGAFYTADGGKTWTAQNRGIRNPWTPEESPEFGHCVHKLMAAPGHPERLYQQNHVGVYRSDDAGQNWTEITAGLPSDFGFPLGVHPHCASTIYTVPLNGDSKGRYMPDGQAAVWRSRDRGATWSRLANGLPQQNAYLNVLREAMATDTHDEPGVYIGTNTGQLFGSRDEGDSWSLISGFLPPITSVEVAVIDA